MNYTWHISNYVITTHCSFSLLTVVLPIICLLCEKAYCILECRRDYPGRSDDCVFIVAHMQSASDAMDSGARAKIFTQLCFWGFCIPAAEILISSKVVIVSDVVLVVVNNFHSYLFKKHLFCLCFEFLWRCSHRGFLVSIRTKIFDGVWKSGDHFWEIVS